MPKIKLPRKVRDLAKKANGGCGDAAWDLSVHYHVGGGGVEQNDELALHWVERAAELGNRSAQHLFGIRRFDTGDYEAARKWWEKAAAQGFADAEDGLAHLYEEGLGVEQNKKTAVEFLLRAASKGHSEAQRCYGCYLIGTGQYEDAMKWFLKAAAQGDDNSMYNIGLCYDNGHGVEENTTTAAEWFLKAASKGHSEAQRCYGCSLAGTGQYEDAMKWYLKAAAQGDEESMYNVGLCYDRGLGVEQNTTTAAEWWLKAASKGIREAQYAYAEYLDDDMKRYADAKEWYERAAAQGDADAMFKLGQLYDEGRGVEQSHAKALYWWKKAAAYDGGEGVFTRGLSMARRLQKEIPALPVRQKLEEKAVAQGDADAAYNLGMLYYAGRGVEHSVSTAREWWERAAAKGNTESRRMLNGTVTEATLPPDRTADFLTGEKILRERAEFFDRDECVKDLHAFRALKRETLLGFVRDSGASISDDAVELFVSGPLTDHKVGDRVHHLALCFLHGRCGLEKNLRMAKEVFKVAEIYNLDNAFNAAVAEELVKLRACVTCGKLDARWGCKLCRGVRYCDKRCQQKDWARGTEPHPPHRETCSRVVNGIMPPWYFALFREQAAMEREAMEREVSN